MRPDVSLFHNTYLLIPTQWSRDGLNGISAVDIASATVIVGAPIVPP
jgi:hypothetical protein